MDERRALMAAIIANPDEDTPRLALADWLQEHGDKHDRARAEFIRLQIEAARLPRGDPSRVKLTKRADAIDRAHAKHWLGPLMPMVKGPFFDRGLLNVNYFTPAAFLKPETQRLLTEWLPRVGASTLVLGGQTKKIELVAGSPVLGLIPALAWWDTQMDDAGLKVLANSPHTSRLNSLTLEKLLATDSGLKVLARSRCFAGLRKLRLLAPVWGGAGISAKGVRALISSDKLPRLDTFALTAHFRIKMPAFCAEPALGRLKSLYLQLVSEPPAPVFRCPHLTNLEELQIDCAGSVGKEVTEEDIRAMVANPALKKLRRFAVCNSLKANRLGDGVVARLRKRFGDGFSDETDLD